MRNRNTMNILGAAVLVVSSQLETTSALAQNVQVGEKALFTNAMICDTESEIRDLADVDVSSKGSHLIEKYSQFNAMLDKWNEPACSVQDIVGAPDEVKPIGEVYFPNGTLGEGYIVRIHFARSDIYIFHGEPVTAL